MIQEGLYTYLAADAGVSALVSSRIYPLVIPETVYTEATKKPCLVYSVDGKSRQVRYSGTDTLVAASVQIDCYARTYLASQQLAEAVRSAMVDYSGTWTGSSSPQTSNRVQSIFIQSEFDMLDPEPGLYRVSQQYTIWYDEA